MHGSGTFRIDPEKRSQTSAKPSRANIDYAIEVLDRYRLGSDPDCTCEDCPQCNKPPSECSGTECAQTCQCSECDHCRVVAAIEGLRSPQEPRETTTLTNDQCRRVVAALEEQEWSGISNDDVRLWDGFIQHARSAVETMAPLPPEVLADALQDVVHTDNGRVRAGRSVTTSAPPEWYCVCSTALESKDAACPKGCFSEASVDCTDCPTPDACEAAGGCSKTTSDKPVVCDECGWEVTRGSHADDCSKRPVTASGDS